MTSLVLVAASGLAREVLAVEHRLDRYDEYFVVDDDPRGWGTRIDGATVVGGVERAVDFGPVELLVCAGRGSVRRRLVDRLTALGVGAERYARLVHPGVVVPPGCTVGPGSILLAGITLTCDVRVGSHVIVMPQVSLTHDDVLEDFVTLCAGVSLGGNVTVGEAAYIGMNASVREHVTIGPEATLGMGSALLGELPAGATWAGVPARALEALHRPGLGR